jgi:protein-S-isoprenylcysteine O-methyltransferase Ste14
VTQASNFLSRWRVRAGYPLAILFLYLASPTMESTAVGAMIAAAGLIVRGAAAGHLRKLETLTTTGPYAWMRNPLYFGSALMAAGFAVAGHSPWAALVIVAYFVAFYPMVMKKEEAELRERYGAAFVEYAKRVPLFFPLPPHGSGAPESGPAGGFSWDRYLKNREYQAALGAILALAVLWVRMYLPR